MEKCLIALALMVLFFSVSAQALSVDIPSTVVVQGELKTVSIAIFNDSTKTGDYSISLSGPFSATISPSYGTLSPGGSAVAMLSIEPSKELAKSTYEASLEVSLGEERAFRNVTVMFKEKEESSEEEGSGEESGDSVNGEGSEDIGENGEGAESTGLFSFGGFSGFFAAVFTLETALNVFLAFFAAILLIAFIARFVKRLEEIR